MINNFPKRPSGARLHALSKFLDVPIGFVSLPHLRQCIALFAVAEGWLLLDVGWFVLFLEVGLYHTNYKALLASGVCSWMKQVISAFKVWNPTNKTFKLNRSIKEWAKFSTNTRQIIWYRATATLETKQHCPKRRGGGGYKTNGNTTILT